MTVLLRNLRLRLADDESELKSIVARQLRVARRRLTGVRILRKSLDTRRGRPPCFIYNLAVDLDDEVERALLARRKSPVTAYEEEPWLRTPFLPGGAAPRPLVVGTGPAGLFAAYRLAQAGRPPLVVERGPMVKERSQRWHRFVTGGDFDTEANLLFGEGGAGTYSDGKLYTRISDPLVPEVLHVLADYGAPREILYAAKPHVGSNLLPSIVRRMREALVDGGVEFRFETKLVDLEVATDADGGSRIVGARLQRGGDGPESSEPCSAIFLAPGHSARDTYRMLAARGVALAQKPFQMGVRVEHPQPLIDTLQYGDSAGHPKLPPAEYSLVAKLDEGDVFSFCMCPGGEVLPATEQPGFICVNGASRYQRTSPFANSGFVVTLEREHFPGHDRAAPPPLAGIELQEQVEQRAAAVARHPFAVPALRLPDFLASTLSRDLPESSYPLPLTVAPFDEFLPPFVAAALRHGFGELGRRLPGFITEEALVVGPESRSSSPLRMVRDAESYESVSMAGLLPLGEGAGYAGGILSAAIDGLRGAEAWLERHAASSESLGSP